MYYLTSSTWLDTGPKPGTLGTGEAFGDKGGDTRLIFGIGLYIAPVLGGISQECVPAIFGRKQYTLCKTGQFLSFQETDQREGGSRLTLLVDISHRDRPKRTGSSWVNLPQQPLAQSGSALGQPEDLSFSAASSFLISHPLALMSPTASFDPIFSSSTRYLHSHPPLPHKRLRSLLEEGGDTGGKCWPGLCAS